MLRDIVAEEFVIQVSCHCLLVRGKGAHRNLPTNENGRDVWYARKGYLHAIKGSSLPDEGDSKPVSDINRGVGIGTQFDSDLLIDKAHDMAKTLPRGMAQIARVLDDELITYKVIIRNRRMSSLALIRYLLQGESRLLWLE